VHRH